MNNKILIIDYKVGNVQSVANALDFLGYEFSVSNSKKEISDAEVYILPGVGAFGEAVKNLNDLEIFNVLKEQVLKKKKPILGICLGFQLLAECSEENGLHNGFGFIEGKVKRLEPDAGIRIPHVGWNNARIIKKDPLFSKLEEGCSFYFDHSYYFECGEDCVAAKCAYGKDVVAAVQKDNIFGVQFHPEKSQTNGLKLFRSFFNYINA